MSTSNTTGNAYAGGIIGKIQNNGQIINVQLNNITLKGDGKINSRVGGLVGFLTDLSEASITLKNNIISQISLVSKSQQYSYVAGVIGHSVNTTIKIDNLNLRNVTIWGYGSYIQKMLYIYYQNGTYQINDMIASGINLINGIQLNNCIFTNIISENGC
ncbi:Hypothetical_protein [Hexamita inflata]|uniref:Hypothetical_protein n=1 Tax=Hexamita inflata TaxID=28002 RepID=A0ABP1HLT6_9EUKA